MKHLLPLTLAFVLAQCHGQMAFQGASYNLVPDCGPRGCGLSYFVNYLDHQDMTEVGFYEGKFYYRQSTFQTHGAGLGALEGARECAKPQYLTELANSPGGTC